MRTKNLLTISVLIIFSILFSACNKEQDANSEKLTQTVQHSTYSMKVPGTWKVEQLGAKDDPYSDPTAIFRDSDDHEVAGLYQLRIDTPSDLGDKLTEIKSLRTSRTIVYKIVNSNKEHLYCVYIPEKNTGYGLYIQTKYVSDKLSVEIIKSLSLKLDDN